MILRIKLNLLLIAFVLALGAAFTANAGEMAPAKTIQINGSVMEGSLIENGSQMVISWDDQVIEFTNHPEPYFEFTIPGREPFKYFSEYFIWIGASSNKERHNCITVDFGNIFYGGIYTISLPAGIVKNENGDTNPAQVFTFEAMERFSEANLEITPPLSMIDNIPGTIIQIPAPFYKSEDLKNVIISSDKGNFQLTGNGTITGRNVANETKDLTSLAKVENGKLTLDLSGLESGQWNVAISSDFLKLTDAEGKPQTNETLFLVYIISDERPPLNSYTVYYPEESYYVTELDYIQLDFGQPVKFTSNHPLVTYTHKGETKNVDTAEVITSVDGSYQLAISLLPSFNSLRSSGPTTINIPAGIVTNGEYCNEAITLKYHILIPTRNLTSNPPAGSTVKASELNTITLTFPNVKSIEPNVNSCKDVEVYGYKDHVCISDYTLTLENNIRIEDNTLILKIPQVDQLDYRISIPALDFIFDGISTNDNINLYYTVWDGLPEATVLSGPVDDGFASPNAKMLLTWDYENLTKTDKFEVVFKEDIYYYDNAEIPLTNGAIKLIAIPNPAGGKGTGLKIDLSEAFSTYLEQGGTSEYFSVTIPEGALQNEEGRINPMKKIRFRLYPESPEPLLIMEDEWYDGTYYIFMKDQLGFYSLNKGIPLILTDSKGNQTDITQVTTDIQNISDVKPGSYGGNWFKNLGKDGLYALIVNLRDLPGGKYTLTVPDGLALFSLESTGYQSLFTNSETVFPITVGQPEITIGEVTYTPYPDGSVHFNVPVDCNNWLNIEDITVYYNGSATYYKTKSVSYNNGEFSFDITGLDLNRTYAVSIYAQADLVKSETVNITFKTFTPVSSPTAYIFNVTPDKITKTTASLAVSYGFINIPEGARTFVVATNEVTNAEIRREIFDAIYGESTTIDITGLTPDTEYSYNVEAIIEDAAGEKYTVSHAMNITFRTLQDTGIDGVDAEEAARYFTLEGIEIENPVPGTICIKVVGNTVTKVIVK